MTTFVYKAKKNTAETVTGKITAQTQDEAIDLINQLGLLPIDVAAESSSAEVSDAGYRRKVKVKELSIFSRQLSNLINSGVSLLRALAIISEQTQNPYFKKVVSRVAWGIKNGRAFSECLSMYPNIFSPLYIT